MIEIIIALIAFILCAIFPVSFTIKQNKKLKEVTKEVENAMKIKDKEIEEIKNAQTKLKDVKKQTPKPSKKAKPTTSTDRLARLNSLQNTSSRNKTK